MRHLIRHAGLILAVLQHPAGAAQAPVTGATAWTSLIGNTLAGTTAEGPYFDYIMPDGTVVHADAEGREAGQWTLKEDRVCFSYPADPDEQVECRRPEVDGPHGAFINADGSRYPFDILPGDARKLR